MKIFLPVDGSLASLAAVHHALQLVRGGLKAHFVLANVQEPPSLYEVVVAHDPVVLDQVRADAGADLLRTAEAMLDAAGLGFESEVAGGDPGHVLVDLIENYGCQAVVMGARGAGESDHPLGSVALALLAHSPVPVTVVRPPRPSEGAAG
ncbi:universal stress protein UspA [beta proteobacterium AAP121]|nr:universal stress protein UspA [beta proteobacterium AAP65]KPF97855.1 universal stress protein UspA [beta proteobacterium AAP121]